MNTQSNISELISSMLDISYIETQDQQKNKQGQHKLEENKQINKQEIVKKKRN